MSEIATENKGQGHSVGTVLALICVMRYINYPQYLLADEKSRERRRFSPRKTNVAFRCAAACSSAVYRKQKMQHVVTLSNIKIEREMILGYGMK